MGVYASKAIQGPVLANAAVAGSDWRKLRENWDKLTAAKE
jgi:methanol corrinoid protein